MAPPATDRPRLRPDSPRKPRCPPAGVGGEQPRCPPPRRGGGGGPALALLGLWLARSFLTPLAWGVLLAVTLWPLYRRFCHFLPERGRGAVLAPLLFTLLAGVALILPLALAAIEAGR